MTLGTKGARSLWASVAWSVEWGNSPAMQSVQVPHLAWAWRTASICRGWLFTLLSSVTVPRAVASSPDGSNSTCPWVDRILPGVVAATPDPPLSPGRPGSAPPVRPSRVRSHPTESAGQDCAPAPGAATSEPRNAPADARPREQRRFKEPLPQWLLRRGGKKKKKHGERGGSGRTAPAAAYLRRRAGPASLGGRTAGRTRPAASRDPRHPARAATAPAGSPPAVSPSTRQ